MIRHYKVPSQGCDGWCKGRNCRRCRVAFGYCIRSHELDFTGYFSATEVWNRYHVPVGMLVASGGTDIESWISQSV